METASIILSSLSIIVALILGSWSVYLALNIKTKKKYWKKIKNINNLLQKHMGNLKGELKKELKKAKKQNELIKINYEEQTKEGKEEQIEQNIKNIKIFLASINNVLLSNPQKVNILFNETLNKQIEEIIFF